MLLTFLVLTLVIGGLRLLGETSVPYQAVAHVFVGYLAGYFMGTYEWFSAVCFVVLCTIEVYSVLVKYFPTLSLGTLLKKVFTPKPAPVVKK